MPSTTSMGIDEAVHLPSQGVGQNEIHLRELPDRGDNKPHISISEGERDRVRPFLELAGAWSM